MGNKYIILILLGGLISCTTTKDLYKQNEQDWHILGDANWTHINNEITGKSDDNTGFLVTSKNYTCLLYTSPSPRDRTRSRMPSSA